MVYKKGMNTKLITQERTPTFIRPDAHAALPRLCELLAQEKQLGGVSFTDAISIAIREAIEKREKELAKA